MFAAGVPWFLDEAANSTFRIGLFGLDKWANVDAKVATLKTAFDNILKK